MKPRERIIAALEHRQTDRIPLDLGATESSGITWIAYNNLKNHLGIKTKTKVFDLMQLISIVEPEVVNFIGADAVPLLTGSKKWKDWEFKEGHIVEVPEKAILKKCSDGSTVLLSKKGIVLSRLPAGGYYFDSVYHPFEKVKELDEIENLDKENSFFKSFDWPYYCDENFQDLKNKAEKLFNNTDFAIVGNLMVHLLASGQDLRGFENFMVDLVVNKPLARKILDKQVQAYIPRIDKYIDAVGKFIQIILVNDDLGTQNGLQMSPEIYREVIKPFHKILWNYIKQKSKKYLLLHSCGSIYELMPDIIELGIDALNPVQISAKDMDPAKIKKEFGKHITLWGGGCDTQKVLPNGTPEEVKAEVRKQLDILYPGGGFIFCQVHNIQPDVPPENIIAMYEELGTLRK